MGCGSFSVNINHYCFIVIGTVVVVFVIVIVALTQALGKGTARQYFPGLFNVVYFPNDECTATTTTGAILGDMVGISSKQQQFS